MINKYFRKAKEFLYQIKIFPIIIMKDPLQPSLDKIVEGMKPVPYEQIKNKPPTEFAKTLRLILDKKINPNF